MMLMVTVGLLCVVQNSCRRDAGKWERSGYIAGGRNNTGALPQLHTEIQAPFCVNLGPASHPNCLLQVMCGLCGVNCVVTTEPGEGRHGSSGETFSLAMGAASRIGCPQLPNQGGAYLVDPQPQLGRAASHRTE